MQLVYRQEPSVDYNLEISVSIEEFEAEKQRISSSSLSCINANLSINFSEEHNSLQELVIEQDCRGAVHPSVFNIKADNEIMRKELTIIGPKSKRIPLRLYCETSDSHIGPFTIEIPSYKAMRFAKALIGRTSGEDRVNNIVDFYNAEGPSEAIFQLLGDLDRWIPIRTHFQMLDAAARTSEEVREAISEKGTTGFLARQIAYPDNEVPYQIRSMQELEQVISTCERLDSIPHISKYETLGRSLAFIEKNEFKPQLWEVETRFEIGRNYWKGLLRDDQMLVLLVISIAKKDYERAHDMIHSWLGDPSESEEIGVLIDKAQKHSDADVSTWRHLLPEATEGSNQQLSFVLCNYLREFYPLNSETEMDLFLQEILCEYHAIVTERINLEIDAEVAKYNVHYIRGQRLRNQEEYSTAYEEYQKATSIALRHAKGSDSPDIINPLMPLYWLHSSGAEYSLQQGNYISGINKLEKGIQIIDSYTKKGISNEQKEFYKTRLQALKSEFEGDKALNNQDLPEANRNYGKAINKYQNINRESEVSYLLQRKGLITASLAEEKGDFDAAKTAHKNIADITFDNDFRQFNTSRATICEAKEALINGDWEIARDLTQEYTDTYGLSGAEADHLELLLDVLEAYEREHVQDIEMVFNRLERLPEIEEVADEFPFEYGHEYRPALANILATQRLQTLDVDTMFLDKLVEISISNVLAPEQAKQEIDQWGIADLGLRQQWQLTFPTHVVRRYQEIEAVAVTTNENLSDQTLGLLRLLEQTLEFAGDYFAHQEIGPDWQHQFANNSEGRLDLGDLRDFLNTDVMRDRVWIDDVRDLLDEPIIDTDSMIGARNLFGHDRQSRLSREGYTKVRERVDEIFTRMASEIPILGEVSGKHNLGAYMFTLHWPHVTNWCYLSTNKDLDGKTIYYLPPDAAINERVVEVDAEDITPCSSNRVLNNLQDYINSDDVNH